MKHYVKVKPEFRGSIDQVAVFAPFAGIISKIDDDFGAVDDQQIWITPDTKSPRQWHFIFFHINIDDQFKEGTAVKAGERLGFANLRRGPDNATDNFDIALKFMRPLHRPAVDAPFAHMKQSVLDEYAKFGVMPDTLSVSKEFRDAHPCPLSSYQGDGPDVYFPNNWPADELVWLNQK